jgi:hypothetical protein
MPVFSRIRDGILVLTADGDYTPGELARVGATAFGQRDADGSEPVLLDLSGAAGLELKSPEAVAAEGAALAAHRDRISRLAVVVSPRHAHLFDGDGPFAEAAGVRVEPCPSHTAAREWLASQI